MLCDRLGLELSVVSELEYPSSVDTIGAYRNESKESHQATIRKGEETQK